MSRDQRAHHGPLSGAVKGIGSLIGLATEAHAHRKEKKAAEKGNATAQDSTTISTIQDSPYDNEQADEEDWALDDASVELSAEPPAYEEFGSDLSTAKAAVTDTSEIALTHTIKPLPCPVILPQRRPQTKSRGFVRAYAPLLGECKGIDEATFLNFLKDFHRESQASPVFKAVNIAGMVAGSVPSVIAMAVSISVQATMRTGIEVQSRQRTNSYLDNINETLFHPRNLHCMVMTYKPEMTGQSFVDVDVEAANTALMKSLSTSGNQSKFRKSDGTSEGEFAIPQAAPLVFPTLDKAVSAIAADGNPITDEKKQSTMKRSGKFIADYIDRRAQAEYAGQHGEDSKLAVPGSTDQTTFASRYADPNHPVNSGSIVALLTGGYIDPKARIRGRRTDRLANIRGQQLSEQDRRNVAMGRGGDRGRPLGLVRKGVRKVMGLDILYLLIAEMPSQEEMEEMTRSTGGRMST